jgi:DNA-binding transcriptional ArsR family regulator
MYRLSTESRRMPHPVNVPSIRDFVPDFLVARILRKYTLTRICRVAYIKSMESFEIIAEPNRRAILSLLVSSQQSVGEIERQLRMTQPTVSKHLRVLRDAGFVESTVDAQRRLYRLKPEPFQELDAWLARFRRFWSDHVDALERHLDRMDPLAPTKRKTNRKRPGSNRDRDKGEKK